MAAVGKQIASLELRVGALETGREQDTDFFISLTREMAFLSGTMNREFLVVHRQLDLMGADVAGLKSGVAVLKADVAGLKADVAGLKADVAEIKSDVSSLKDDMSAVLRILTENFGK